MALNSFVFLLLLSLLAPASSASDSTSPILDVSSLNRSSFPKGFIFGTASSAYQYEGAANIDGRGPSIWDTFCHKYPEKIKDGKNGDVAVDAYHRYKEDVKIMKELNLDAYRFSISWSRILPKGKLSGGINQEGIRYYHNLIDQLLAKGLTPFVTIFHWDLPQALEDEYGGFLSRHIVNDFRDYSELCFKEFGDKVKHWITLNEPLSYSKIGYSSGKYAPGRCSAWLNQNCTGGDSGTEPYLVSHNLLLSHAAAVKVYKTKYQRSQRGVIGISLITDWFVPLTDKKEEKEAALRALDFMFGWYMTPLTSGEYPESMRTLVKNRLPKFTKEESRLLKGSFDFLGLNYYSSHYASNAPNISTRPYYETDSLVNVTNERDGMPIGPMAASELLYVYPRGLREILLYIKTKYNDPVIYITENGYDEPNDPTLSLEESLLDTYRIDFHFRHLYYLHSAMRDGVNDDDHNVVDDLDFPHDKDHDFVANLDSPQDEDHDAIVDRDPPQNEDQDVVVDPDPPQGEIVLEEPFLGGPEDIFALKRFLTHTFAHTWA
ncbi:hypothetical protein L6164_023841 [Bauhinia variegata]|uniref:Uncharacterized protein n=1 Tax=Bauhinia variegata TaxID=167791 RepID=A0ACB9MPS5_BAUVA|nr:hypothetical protein L6164_023841 [Bauhinia variegata]